MTPPPGPAVPPRPQQKDWYAPALLAASLLAHGAALALLLRAPHAAAAKPPAEISVEVVQQMPAEKAAAPPPKAPRSAEAPKPAAATPARSEKQAAKPATPKPATPRPPKAAAAPKAVASKESPSNRAEPPAAQNVADRMAALLGPMPAAVMPTTAGADNPFDDSLSYKQMVLSKVARQRREDRHNGIPGHVVVAFAIGDSGEVVSCAVREKSADPALDDEAMAMVRRGEPYPAPPPGAPREFSFGLAFRPS